MNLILQVYIGNTLCGEVQYKDGKNIYEILCDYDVVPVGKNVKVELKNEYLTLCEVKAFGGENRNANYPFKKPVLASLKL